jgi:outer membrane protein assembly factor BamB
MKNSRVFFYVISIVFLFIFQVTAFSSGLVESPWPRYKGDVRNTGRSQYKGPDTDALKWSYDTGAPVSSTPAIGADGSVYIANEVGDFFTFSPDGSLKWKISLGEQFLSSPTLGEDGTIYIPSYVKPETGTLFALTPLIPMVA